MTAVNITVRNDNSGHTLLSGVSVYVYNTSAILQTSNVTNGSGVAVFNLPDATYDLLFFKPGFSVLQPQRIVVDTLLVNNFQINGHLRTLPESLDTSLCRVSGYVLGTDGKPNKEVEIRLDQMPTSIIANDRFIFNSPIQKKSDDKGYFEFDILRNVKYEAGIDGYPKPIYITSPNVAAVNASDLLFPLPVLLEISASTVGTSIGATNSSLTFTATYSDTNTGRLYNDWSSVEVNYSVPGIATLSGNETNLYVHGMATGTTVATFTRVINPKYQWINPQPFVAPTLTITVS